MHFSHHISICDGFQQHLYVTLLIKILLLSSIVPKIISELFNMSYKKFDLVSVDSQQMCG
jgi:hypothetical protein